MATIPSLPGLAADATIEQVIEHVSLMQKTMNYVMSCINSTNITEVGGWVANDTDLMSEDAAVGFSSKETGTDDLRIWAGSAALNTAPFRVYKSGLMVATNAQISGGSISWGDVDAPLYSDILGVKPPANADNTDTIVTAGGSNFTKVAGAYVYSGPADYTQITGVKPPSNADNTNTVLPASLGINYTKIGTTYIYTGVLNANQINAGTLNANYINGGTITSVGINVTQDITVGNNIYFNPADISSNKSLNFAGRGSLEFRSNLVRLSGLMQIDLQCGLVTYNSSEIATQAYADSRTAKFG